MNKRLIFWTLLLFSMWMILTNNLEMANIFLGIIISFLVALLYTKLFNQEEFAFINPFYLFLYILILIKNLLISNLQIAKKVLSKDMKLSPAIVGVKTELKNDWKKLLLANSITLTPGTLTLDIEDDVLYIHVLQCENLESKERITKEFENIISKI